MNNNKQLIILDWLQIHYRAEIPTFKDKNYFQLNKDCFIKYTYSGSKNFLNVDELFINGVRVATIQHNPRSSVNNDNTIILKFENELFYSKSIAYYMDYINNILQWENRGVTRMDIAADTIKQAPYEFTKKYYHLTGLKTSTYKTKIVGKAKPYINNGTIYLGSKSSDKQIKIYNKSKELETNNKRHIKAYYKRNGIDYKSNEVIRFELSISGKKGKNIDLSKIEDTNYLTDILKKECKGFFEFRKEVTRAGKKKIIDVTPIKFKPEFSTTYNKLQVTNNTTLNSIFTAKRTIKSLYMENKEKLNSYNLNIDSVLNELIRKNDLQEWFNSKKPYYDKEAESKTSYELINKLHYKMTN